MVKPVEDVHHQLAEFASAISFSDIPSPVRARATLVACDTFGAILAGSLEPEVRGITRCLLAAGRGSEATILGSGFEHAPAPVAALVNAAAGTVLEVDEFYWPYGHPAIHVLPAALALAEGRQSGGTDLITALVLGYEVAVRVAKGSRMRQSVHTHGHFGTVGAAVACAKLLGFGTAQMADAIGVASSLTLATPARATTAGATVRNLFAGVSSQIGVLAVYAVTGGFTGLVGGLQETFGSILGEEFDPSALTVGLGEQYGIATNNFKFHAAAARIHPALDATLALRRQVDPDVDEVCRLRVVTDHRAAQMNRTDPPNQLAAKFSIPFAVATALVHGVADDRAFGPESVADSRTRALAVRVEVVEDTNADEGTAIVELHMTDGRRLLATGSLKESPAREDIAADLRDKFERLAAPVLHGSCGRVWDVLEQLESYEDVSVLTGLLARCATEC